MKTKICFLLILCLGGISMSSCHRPDRELPVVDCQLVASYSQFSDSSFFKNISCMAYGNGRLYMFDRDRGDVVAWGMKTDSSFYAIGSIGGAPHELIYPIGFTLIPGDTTAILDIGSSALKLFRKNEYVRSVPAPGGVEEHFFIDRNFVYLPHFSDSTCYVKVDMYREREDAERIKNCGHPFSITDNPEMNTLRNTRHLVKGNGCLYAVCPSYPVIEKYDLQTDELLESYDLSEVSVIKERLSYIDTHPLSGKSFYVFLADVCWHNDKLYLLYPTWDEKYGYLKNSLLVLDCQPWLTPLCVYQLPDQIYNSFTVDNEYIYASNYVTSCIEIYQPKGDKDTRNTLYK